MWQKAVVIWNYSTSFTEILLLGTALSQARGQIVLSRLEVHIYIGIKLIIGILKYLWGLLTIANRAWSCMTCGGQRIDSCRPDEYMQVHFLNLAIKLDREMSSSVWTILGTVLPIGYLYCVKRLTCTCTVPIIRQCIIQVQI